MASHASDSNTHASNNPQDLNSRLTRSQDVWFRDGTIVVQAETTVFRVYQGILARSSSLFDDLFNIPQPVEGGAMYDGVPLVVIEESAVEMTLFLRVLHEWRFEAEGLPLKDAIILAHLSSKYCVDNLFAVAIAVIKLIYGAANLDDYLSQSTRPSFLAADPGDHIAVVNMARKCNVPELLPTAFYRAALSLAVEDIIGGFNPISTSAAADVDSSPDKMDTTASQYTPPPPGRPPISNIIRFDDIADAVTCIEGKVHLTMTSNIGTLFSIHPAVETDSNLRWKPCNHCKDIPTRFAALIKLFTMRQPGIFRVPRRSGVSTQEAGDGKGVARIEWVREGLQEAYTSIEASMPVSSPMRLCELCLEPFYKWATRWNQEQVWKSIRVVFKLVKADEPESDESDGPGPSMGDD